MAKKLEIKLSANVIEALRKITKVDNELDDISSSANKSARGLRKINNAVRSGTSRALAGINRRLDAMGGKLTQLGKWAMVGLTAAVAGGAVYAGSKIVDLGVKMEQTRMSFQTMLGSAEKGNAVLGMLNKFANVTPFTNDEVTAAGKTLLSYGIEAAKLQKMLKTVGDVAAGSGKNFTELSAIIGKTFAKGKADSEALNQMSEAGIPIVKTLSEMYGKSAQEIYKMAEKGQLTKEVITSAFERMTGKGGVFADMMKKQSETVGGLWSTVTGKLQLFAATIGEQVTPLLKIGLQYIMGWVDELAAMASDGRAVQYMATIGITGATAIGGIIKWLNRLYEYGSAVFKTLQRVSSIQFESMQAVIAGAFSFIADKAIKGLNMLISAANKARAVLGKDPIPLIEKPDWINKVGDWARHSAEQVKKDFTAIITGKDFSDAAGRVKSKNDKVDQIVDSINSKLGKWQADEQEKIARRKLDEKKYENELSGKAKTAENSQSAIQSQKLTQPKINVDSLTRVGLYNFGPAIKSIDIERNSLLKEISKKLDGQTKYKLA